MIQLFIDIGDRDPLQYAYGLPWYARKPSSLTKEEWTKLRNAVAKGVVNSSEYVDWEENVR